MGYRTYIGKIGKNKYESVKDLKSKEELFKVLNLEWDNVEIEDNYIGVYDLVDKTLHELGKYVPVFGEDYRVDFFTNKELQSYYESDYELYVCTKEFFKAIIDMYSDNIRTYYKKMLKPFFTEENNRFSRSEFLASAKRGIDEETFNDTYQFDFSKITDKEQTAIMGLINHVRDMGMEWGINAISDDTRPYDLDQTDYISNSWKYEYVIYELIKLYNDFDWENDILVYYGY